MKGHRGGQRLLVTLEASLEAERMRAQPDCAMEHWQCMTERCVQGVAVIARDGGALNRKAEVNASHVDCSLANIALERGWLLQPLWSRRLRHVRRLLQ